MTHPSPSARGLFWLIFAVIVVTVAASAGVLALTSGTSISTLVVGAKHWIDANAVLALALFAVWALAANCIVIPAGSVSLIAAGALFGPLWPALIWYGSQIVTAPLPHAFGRILKAESSTRRIGGKSIDQWTLPFRHRLASLVDPRPVMASVLLRLCPLVPSAVAALIAATIGIGLRPFLLGSLLVGWARPLYFTSVGASLKSLTEPQSFSTASGMLPLFAIFLTATLIVAAQAWLSRRG